MTRRTSWTAIAAVGLILGYILGSVDIIRPAHAQQSDSPQSKYQVSAYAGQGEEGVHHGCYVLDTTTGAVWHVVKGGQAERVAQRLP
ncbi:MAG: hypothetical protein WD851_01760 [Pirellulales bacterium]